MGAFDDIIAKYGPQPDQQVAPAPPANDAVAAFLSVAKKNPAAAMREPSGHTLRLSPLKYPEVTLPFNVGTSDYAVLGSTGTGKTQAGQKIYSLPEPIRQALDGYYADDPVVVYGRSITPTTVAHERIHVGQQLSGYRDLNEPLLGRILNNAQKSGFAPQGPQLSSPREIAAYSFENPKNYNRDDFAAYMDDVHLKAPRPWSLEASMPQESMTTYLKTHPVPYNKRPVVNMQEIKEK